MGGAGENTQCEKKGRCGMTDGAWGPLNHCINRMALSEAEDPGRAQAGCSWPCRSALASSMLRFELGQAGQGMVAATLGCDQESHAHTSA